MNCVSSQKRVYVCRRLPSHHYIRFFIDRSDFSHLLFSNVISQRVCATIKCGQFSSKTQQPQTMCRMHGHCSREKHTKSYLRAMHNLKSYMCWARHALIRFRTRYAIVVDLSKLLSLLLLQTAYESKMQNMCMPST